MPYEEVAPFIAELRKREATSALAWELCILTAARSGEILGMRWSEIDFDNEQLTIPRERMKGGIAHTVPLSTQALALLNSEFAAGRARRFALCRGLTWCGESANNTRI
jgi:integrase